MEMLVQPGEEAPGWFHCWPANEKDRLPRAQSMTKETPLLRVEELGLIKKGIF
jgi:hypothetical protein